MIKYDTYINSIGRLNIIKRVKGRLNTLDKE